MKELIIALSVVNVLFVFMHEFDACYREEWRMFKFLRKIKEEKQYLIFLYIHIPLTFFLVYYLWTVIKFNNFTLWIIWNAFLVFHLIIHLIATKWKSNVFHNIHSFIFIGGAGISGLISLLLFNFY